MEKLEVLEIQCLLGYKEGVDSKDVTPGFFCRLTDTISSFLRKERIEHMTVHQSFVSDDQYKGASRDLAVSRNGLSAEERVLKRNW